MREPFYNCLEPGRYWQFTSDKFWCGYHRVVSYNWQQTVGGNAGSGTIWRQHRHYCRLTGYGVHSFAISPTNFSRFYILQNLDENRLNDVNQ
ncbi:MAG: hypothetical protein U0T74_06770 [Chitinophagales bacterium]